MTRGDLQDRAVRGALWTVLHVVVSLPVAFVVNLLLARVLGVVGYGRLAILSSTTDIATLVLGIGMSGAVLQYGSKACVGGDLATAGRLLSKSQGFRLIVVAPALSALILVLADMPTAILLLTLAFGIWLPAAISGAPLALGIENKTAQDARINMLGNLITQGVVIGAVMVFATPDTVWSARLLATGATAALALIPIASVLRRAVLRPALPRGFPNGFWSFAASSGIAGLVALLVTSRSEIFVLRWVSSPAQVGLYALAFGLTVHLFAPAQALMYPMLPAVSGLRAIDRSAVAGALARTIRVGATVVACLVAVALPPVAALVPTLYGSEYAIVPPMLLVLGLGGALGVLASPVQAFALARLSGRTVLVVNVVALTVDAVTAVTLCPWIGAWGAAVANVLAGSTRLVVMLWAEVRAGTERPRLLAGALLPVALGGLAALAGWTVATAVSGADFTGPSVWMAALLAAVVGGLGLMLATRFTSTGLTSGDVDAVARVMPGRVSGVVRRILRPLANAREP